MPLFGSRVFALRIPGTPTGGPFGKNKLVFHDEFVSSEIGQVGTQFDGLGHIGCITGKDGDMTEMRFYNGFTEAEMANAYGLQKLGIEKCKPFFTRGVLVDVAGLKGRMLNMGEEISVADVQAALQKQGIAESSIQPGDGVFFNTGWSSLWMKDNAKFNEGEPGIGLDVARWCVAKQVALVGADTWATEVVPNPNADLAFIVHNELITKNGIFNHENLDFAELIKDKVSEFVYVFAPLRIKGGTGLSGPPYRDRIGNDQARAPGPVAGPGAPVSRGPAPSPGRSAVSRPSRRRAAAALRGGADRGVSSGVTIRPSSPPGDVR